MPCASAMCAMAAFIVGNDLPFRQWGHRKAAGMVPACVCAHMAYMREAYIAYGRHLTHSAHSHRASSRHRTSKHIHGDSMNASWLPRGNLACCCLSLHRHIHAIVHYCNHMQRCIAAADEQDGCIVAFCLACRARLLSSLSLLIDCHLS